MQAIACHIPGISDNYWGQRPHAELTLQWSPRNKQEMKIPADVGDEQMLINCNPQDFSGLLSRVHSHPSR